MFLFFLKEGLLWRYIRSVPPLPRPLQLPALTTHVAKNARLAPDVLPRFPSSRLEMPIMSYRDRGVNKILKQQCLLRLSLQVPDGDYGTVQILVWPEIGALLNYGSDGEAAGNAKNR